MVDQFVSQLIQRVPQLAEAQSTLTEMDEGERATCLAELTLEAPCVLCGDPLRGPPRYANLMLSQLLTKRGGAEGRFRQA